MVVMRPAVTGQIIPAPPVAREYAKLIDRLTELSPPPKTVYNILDKDELLRFSKEAQPIVRELDQHHVMLQGITETVNKKLSTSFGKYTGLFGRLCVCSTASITRMRRRCRR